MRDFQLDKEKKESYDELGGRPYDEKLAAKIVYSVRGGRTLSKACELQKVDRRSFFDWMRDPTCMLGAETLEAAYQSAKDDQALSWQDDAIEDIAGTHLDGYKSDGQKLRKVDLMAAMKARQAKEHLTSTRRRGGASAPTVVIKRFTVLEEEEDDS